MRSTTPTADVARRIEHGASLLVVAAGVRRWSASWPLWVLPFALTVDNLTYGFVGEHSGSLIGQASEQLVSSSLLAFVGLVVAAWLPQVVAAMRRAAATMVVGVALLLAAGALFVVG